MPNKRMLSKKMLQKKTLFKLKLTLMLKKLKLIKQKRTLLKMTVYGPFYNNLWIAIGGQNYHSEILSTYRPCRIMSE